MLTQVPDEIVLIFILATLATLLQFITAIKQSTNPQTRKTYFPLLLGLLAWLGLQAALTYFGIYSDTSAIPPKLVLFGVLPMLMVMVGLFVRTSGQQFMDSLSLKALTQLHMVRLLVEVVLLKLYLHGTVPQLMTFEGRNFDILSGITAPLMAIGWSKNIIPRKVLLLWNVGCLGLLFNIVINALLAAPTPLQQFAFDQPNIAVFHFPFSWLPTFIVPVVLFSHLVAIRQLLKPQTT